ncbi:ABC transporter substrate-binding protein [Staphylococcus sp. SQ8-PEA]|uniref:ABC transporter substrate-binding protein n=1 Tax=Staphylococcus marylandisciuri TaxID=2981529 RepID=A0ABT2QSQ6_9STAP|nr:ABC transporter substrate-binding protein [Staphylococcus marylandisciuri]MCU5747004.1 ABC transporter substrate-binding protein [Staphylococcus marylandisciuri]
MASIVNEDEKAEKWIKKWERTLKADRAKLSDKINGKSIAVLQSTPKGITAFGKNYGRGTEIVYDGYGMKQPKKLKAETKNAYMVNMSLESLHKYTGDYIILANMGEHPNFTNTNSWKNLKAVKHNKVLNLDISDTQYNDPISLERQRKILFKQLEK